MNRRNITALSSAVHVFMKIVKVSVNLLLNQRELEVLYYALFSATRRINDRIANGWNTESDSVYLAALARITEAASPTNAHWKS